jgi:hypothetical protein
MTFILAVSGKKQSGKDTLLSYLTPILGKIGTVKNYSFAMPLKEWVINTLGLEWEQVWGSDANKNSLTPYKWDNLPVFVRWINSRERQFLDMAGLLYRPKDIENIVSENEFITQCELGCMAIGLRTGFMTAREVMQVMGTDIMRKMFSDNVWVDTLQRAIEKDRPDFALICDMRFPAEFLSFYRNHGARVVRLMRDVSNGDQHPSEVALDNWEWTAYPEVLVIPSDADIEQTRALTMSWLTKMIPELPEG